jgi:hypothetical protein
MSVDIRDYLLERFSADASTLRQRAASMQGLKKAPSGPSAAVSSAMADACDQVVRLATGLPEDATVDEIVSALREMMPELEKLAGSQTAAANAPVRAVYMGAITRVQELIAAETGAQKSDGNGDVDGSEDDDE